MFGLIKRKARQTRAGGGGLYGTREAEYRRFGGGLVLDQDPGEIGEDQSPDCLNVDLDEETVAKRRGWAYYNSAAPTGAATAQRGVFAYQPTSGGEQIVAAFPESNPGTGLVIAADTNRDGDFGDANELLALGEGVATSPVDFIQHRATLYVGHSQALAKWTGSGSLSSIAMLTAPAAAPTLAPENTLLEAFDSGTWTLSGSNITTAFDTAKKKEGSGALKVTAATSGAEGSFIYKAFSAGSTVDLSQARELVFWAMADAPGVSFQIGIYVDGATLSSGPTWGDFAVHTIERAKEWVRVRVPLGAIAPANRDASPGLAIRWIDDGGRGYNPDLNLWLDDCRQQGPLELDHYQLVYTYYDSTNDRESNPSAAAEFDVTADAPVKGINLTVVSTAQSGVDKIRIYQHRSNGPFRRKRMVKEVSNANATHLIARDDGSIAVDPTSYELVENKANPPLGANSWALVNNRMLAGRNETSVSKVWLSRFGYPEEFRDTQTPFDDPLGPGWFILPTGERIVRILDHNGSALIFCQRSIFSLHGSAWFGEDELLVAQRAQIGLDARWAVAVAGQIVYFLAQDGVRVLVPSVDDAGLFATWVISEPVNSRLETIPDAYRADCAMGIDERGRLFVAYVRSGQTVPDRTLVFDPTQPGALDRSQNPRRPGWTEYDFGFSCAHTLRRGGGWAGQMVVGDPSVAKLRMIAYNRVGTLVETDDGAAVAWHWTSRRLDAGPGHRLAPIFAGGVFDAAASQSVTATPVVDGAASGTTASLALGSASSGQVAVEARLGVGALGRLQQMKISGSQSVAMRLRKLVVGYHRR